MFPALVEQILRFRRERDWEQFHSPRTLASSISIEAAELLEVFQWAKDADLSMVTETKRHQIEQEIADIAIYLLLFVHDVGIDLEQAIARKLEQNALKYPVESSRGRSDKYNEIDNT